MKFDYSLAFSRNLGLLTPEEQNLIKKSRVAIAGMGGVGGVHLITLIRMGFTKFTIADFDHFEMGNFNRQFGANLSTLNRHKGEVMKEMALAINPDADIRLVGDALTPETVNEFLDGASIFVDGIDVFEIQIRKAVFAKARELNIWSVSAGPIGFSTAWITYDPRGMSFEKYCGFSQASDEVDDFVAFVLALTPAATQFSYLDTSYVSYSKRKGPSNMLACQLCSGVMGAEVLKILLGRGKVKPAPYYHQFDSYLLKYKTGRLLFGGANPWSRMKRWFLKKRLLNMDKSFNERINKSAA